MKTKTYKLAICIPTSNRIVLLKNALEKLYRIISVNDVCIFILDGSNTRDIENMVNYYRDKYKNLYYKHYEYNAEKNIYYDKFYDRWHVPNAEYYWTCSDSRIPTKNCYDYVLRKINSGFDLLLLNVMDYKVNNSRIYKNYISFFIECSWQTQIMGVNVISFRLIEHFWNREDTMKEVEIESSFIEMRQIFTALSEIENPKCIYSRFINQPYIAIKKNTTSSSYNKERMFPTFIDGVITSIDRLPKVYEQYKRISKRRMSTKSHWFTFDGFCLLKSKGILNYKSFLQYRKKFKIVSQTPLLVIALILLLPDNLAGRIRESAEKYRYLRSNKADKLLFKGWSK